MTPILETDRLVLRPLTLADAPAAQELFPKWEIVRHLNQRIPWPYPADGALTFYRDVVLPAVECGRQWAWAIRLKQGPDHMIGSIALIRSDDENRAFWLGVPWQGLGLMSEACIPVTDFWFNTLNFPTLRVPKAAANVRSRRISEKQRMRLIRTEERGFVSGRMPAEIWEVTREEWNAQRSF